MSGKYSVIIYWSEDDAAFLAHVPELPGCVADGQTYEEVVTELQIVIEGWIDMAKEFGQEIPKPKTRPHFADLADDVVDGFTQQPN